MAVIRLFKKMSFDLKVSSGDAFLTWLGRLFHSVGPATEKEQSPNFVEDSGTCRKFLDEDRSLLSATLMQKSDM